MKIEITKAEPILAQKFNTQTFAFRVSRWLVSGKYIMDENECWCGAKPFETYIEPEKNQFTNQLSIGKSELESLVKNKLKQS